MDRFDIDTNSGRAAQQQALSLAEFVVRGSAHMLKLQSTATRALLATHGRSATLLGAPDWTAVLSGPGSAQFEELLDAGAEQAVRILRTSNDTVQQVQQQFASLVEQQARTFTDQVRSSIEEMTRRSRESMERFGRLSDEAAHQARQAGEEAQRAAQGASRQEQPPQSIITPASEASASAEERGRARRGA